MNAHKKGSGRVSGTVFVGLSGGVDSSVTAFLLKKEGFRVVGIHLRCWNEGGCDVREAEDARRVAEHLGIPFYVFDMEDVYRRRVVDYMIKEYERGRTPNPDVMCNREVKFGLFLEKAVSLGADHIATGHYVRRRMVMSARTGSATYTLFKGKDVHKDQSYFLWTLTQEQIRRSFFPIGDLEKSKVREIARALSLPTADKKDSQGICFVGNIPLRDFLRTYIPDRPGDVYDTQGALIGTHRGVQFYTIGQRHGFTITRKTPESLPHYIVKKDVLRNVLVVAEGAHDERLFRRDVSVHGLHFIDPHRKESFVKKGTLQVFARVRYGQPVSRATLRFEGGEKADVCATFIFDTPQQFVAAGQSVVMYLGSGEMVGGGIISE